MHAANHRTDKQSRRDDSKHHLKENVDAGWNLSRRCRTKRDATKKEMLYLANHSEKITIEAQFITHGHPQ